MVVEVRAGRNRRAVPDARQEHDRVLTGERSGVRESEFRFLRTVERNDDLGHISMMNAKCGAGPGSFVTPAGESRDGIVEAERERLFERSQRW